MGKTRHTPGPWTFVSRDKSFDPICDIGAINAHETPHKIGEIYRYEDARLVSAAPTLLSALESMVKVFNSQKPDPLQAFATIERARSAIAKARGQS